VRLPQALACALFIAGAGAHAQPTEQRTNVDGLLHQAFDDMKRNDIAGADDKLTRAQQIEPDHPYVLLNLASVYAKECRTEEARALFRRVALRDAEAGAKADPAAASTLGARTDELNASMVGRTPAQIARYNLTRLKRCDEPTAVMTAAALNQPDRSERISLQASELFAFDSAELRAQQPQLDQIAGALIRYPQIKQVIVNGHTDEIGTEAYNEDLSLRRAQAAKAYLVSKGVDESRIVARGHGATQPVVHCPPQPRESLVNCLAPNRRIDVEPVTFERRVE